MAVITKATPDHFKEILVKGFKGKTAPSLSSPFFLTNSGISLVHFYLGKMPGNASTEWHPKPTHAGALPATEVTKMREPLKRGLLSQACGCQLDAGRGRLMTLSLTQLPATQFCLELAIQLCILTAK